MFQSRAKTVAFLAIVILWLIAVRLVVAFLQTPTMQAAAKAVPAAAHAMANPPAKPTHRA